MNNYSGGDSSSDDVVSFPVPKRYLSAIIQALARIIETDQQGSSSQNASASGPAVPWPVSDQEVEEIHIEWNEEKLRSLRKRLNNLAALTLLDMAADKPNERIGVEDVMQKLGCSHGQVGAGLGVLTKSINKMLNLKNKRYNWPAPFHWDAEQQKTYYLMDEAVAAAWKATAADNSTPTQRDVMCGLVAQFGMNEERVIQEYANAERRGEVERKSNEYDTASESYARALWKDGVRKGWLSVNISAEHE